VRFEDDEIVWDNKILGWDFPAGVELATRALMGLVEKSPPLLPSKTDAVRKLDPFDMLNSTVTQSIYSRTFGNARFSTHLADFISMNTSPEGF
jgi:hypothetical protein